MTGIFLCFKSKSFFVSGFLVLFFLLSHGQENVVLSHRQPVVVSEWKRIVYYPDNHLNDFCIFQDRDNVWHAMGIMGTGTWDSEQSLFHCFSDTLLSEFTKSAPILTETPEVGVALQKHAPFVIWHNEYYHMFYRRPQGTILKLKSKDPFHWKGLGEVVFEENDARDICIRKINGIFYMYYCQYINFEGTNRSAILLRKSEDLESWGEPIISYVELEHEVRHSKLESPFVVEEDDGYYLFVRNRHLEDSVTTVVLFSENPERFPSGTQTWFAELNFIHAPEIVKFKGAYYVVRVSGAKHAGGKTRKKEGWLEVTELRFE